MLLRSLAALNAQRIEYAFTLLLFWHTKQQLCCIIHQKAIFRPTSLAGLNARRVKEAFAQRSKYAGTQCSNCVAVLQNQGQHSTQITGSAGRTKDRGHRPALLSFWHTTQGRAAAGPAPQAHHPCHWHTPSARCVVCIPDRCTHTHILRT